MAYIELTKGGSDSRTKGTISCWVKRSKLGSEQYVWGWGEANNSDAYLRFDSGDNIEINCDGAGSVYNSTALYRDTNAWYHLVFSLDGSNATANLRRRFWVNGVQQDEGNGSISTFSSAVMGWLSTQDLWIGANPRSQNGSSISAFDGYISHFHYCDGYSYAASDFGETDAVTGEWKIKTEPSVNYGTSGFFCKMENGSNMDEDSSGNNKTLVTNGTINLSQDNPSNIFAVFNAISNADATLSNGNTSCLTNSGTYADRPVMTTLGMTKGKYYCEIKAGTLNTGATWEYGILGITGRPLKNVTGSEQYQHLGSVTEDFGYYAFNGHLLNNSGSSNTDTAYGNTWTTNDIIGIAVDIDNSKLYFSKNGVWQDSGDPTSGATGTGAISIDAVSSTTLGAYFFAVGAYHYTPRYNFYANFGNGYFGTTAVSSAGTNASNIGIFEYDVPAGYTALCTKGLNSF